VQLFSRVGALLPEDIARKKSGSSASSSVGDAMTLFVGTLFNFHGFQSVHDWFALTFKPLVHVAMEVHDTFNRGRNKNGDHSAIRDSVGITALKHLRDRQVGTQSVEPLDQEGQLSFTPPVSCTSQTSEIEEFQAASAVSRARHRKASEQSSLPHSKVTPQFLVCPVCPTMGGGCLATLAFCPPPPRFLNSRPAIRIPTETPKSTTFCSPYTLDVIPTTQQSFSSRSSASGSTPRQSSHDNLSQALRSQSLQPSESWFIMPSFEVPCSVGRAFRSTA